jgi:hypothetical protein
MQARTTADESDQSDATPRVDGRKPAPQTGIFGGCER